MKKVFTCRLDDDVRQRLESIAAETRLSRSHLVREALRAQYGINPSSQAPPLNLDPPWLGRNGEHG
jgi:predicted transcriptional regulator